MSPSGDVNSRIFWHEESLQFVFQAIPRARGPSLRARLVDEYSSYNLMYNIDLTALVTSHQPKLFSLLLESLHLCPTKGLA